MSLIAPLKNAISGTAELFDAFGEPQRTRDEQKRKEQIQEAERIAAQARAEADALRRATTDQIKELYQIKSGQQLTESAAESALRRDERENETTQGIRAIKGAGEVQKALSSSKTDDQLRLQGSNQEFIKRLYEGTRDFEGATIDKFLGNVPLAQRYFDLENRKLGLAEEAYRASSRPLNFIERIAPSLVNSALLFGASKLFS